MKHVIRLVCLVLMIVGFVPHVTYAQGVKCGALRASNCFDILILNAEYDAAHPTMAQLLSDDEAAVSYRVFEMGAAVRDAYRMRQVKEGPQRVATVMMWNVNEVDDANIASHHTMLRSNNTLGVVATTYDIRRTTDYAQIVFDDSVSSLGEPQVVYKVELNGFGTSMHVPWEMIDPENTVILICFGEEYEASQVYPKFGEGLYLLPEHLTFFKAGGGPGVIVPTVSTSNPSVAQVN